MGTENLFLDILISALITVGIILPPYIIIRAIKKIKITTKQAKIITVIIAIITYIIFLGISFVPDTKPPSIPPIIIWNIVGYFIIRDKCTDVEKPVKKDPNYVDYRLLYEEFKRRGYDINYATQYYLVNNFLSLDTKSITAKEDFTVNIKFDGSENKFNGFLILDSKQNIVDFAVLIFDDAVHEFKLHKGEILYYINCKVNTEQSISHEVERITDLYNEGKITKEEYLNLIKMKVDK